MPENEHRSGSGRILGEPRDSSNSRHLEKLTKITSRETVNHDFLGEDTGSVGSYLSWESELTSYLSEESSEESMSIGGMEPYAKSIASILAQYEVDLQKGLTKAQYSRSRAMYGPNSTEPPPSTSFWTLVLKQFEDTLVIILLIAMCVSFGLALTEEGSNRNQALVEPLVILFILIANAVVGVWQESRAESAIASLNSMIAVDARVCREGVHKVVDAADLVPGDVVVLTAGDLVPADIRLLQIESSVFETDESMLTGESEPVGKHTHELHQMNLVVQDQHNMLFSSTLVTRGKGLGVVVRTGTSAAIGKIQQDLVSASEENQKTPLQKQLDGFGDTLSRIIMGICILVWIINIGHFSDPEYGSFFGGAVYYFKIAIALAVAAIPEGLPAVVTTCLALGTQRMAQKNAIVRCLPSVETLGCTSVICSDKTGTLTTNCMSCAKICVAGRLRNVVEYDVSDSGYSPHGRVTPSDREGDFASSYTTVSNGYNLARIAQIATLCNDAVIEQDPVTRTFKKNGDATEAALKVVAEKLAVDEYGIEFDACHQYWNRKLPRLHLLEFDRKRKSMSVVVGSPKASHLLVKGAPENLLSRCSNVLLPDGSLCVLNRSYQQSIQERLQVYAEEGMRCLALAYQENVEISSRDLRDSSSYESIESRLIFVGLVALLDPPRESARDSIAECRAAGIRVIVITGDSVATATAICQKLNLGNINACTGSELIQMDEMRRQEYAAHCNLFARVEPSHKKVLVELLQNQGHIVAMTGDGVNDAPALKQANIGVAMGSGTAVAREASDMVLQDDNFATIVTAVEEGRAIYANTKQFLRYLISSNIGEVVCIFGTAALGIPDALRPIQLLWVNLVTDGLPATALSCNPPDPDVMRRPPRGQSDALIDSWLLLRYVSVGFYVGIATITGFLWWFTTSNEGPGLTFTQLASFHTCNPRLDQWKGVDCSVFEDPRPSTVSLSILVTVEMLNALNALSEQQSLLVVPPSSNPWVLIAVLVSFLLHFVILYLPSLAQIFATSPLSFEAWRMVWFCSIPVILLDEAFKWASRTGAGNSIVRRLVREWRIRLGHYVRLKRSRDDDDNSRDPLQMADIV